MASLRRSKSPSVVALFLLLLSLTALVFAQDYEDEPDEDENEPDETENEPDEDSPSVGQDAPMTTHGPDFNGYQFHVEDGTTSPIPIYCGNNQYYSSSGDYVHCCLSGYECLMATECNGATQVFEDGSEEACNDGWLCKTMTVFEEFPDVGPIHTDIFCDESDWDVHTVYRSIPTSSNIASAPSTAETRPGPSSPSTPTPTTTETNNPSESSDPKDSDSDSGPNAGLIAGAVVGPVVGLALIAVALWLIRDKIKAWFSGNPSDGDGGAAAAAGAAGHAHDIKPGPAGYGYVPPHDPALAAAGVAGGVGKDHYGPSELATPPPPVVYELPAPYTDSRPLSQELPADSSSSPGMTMGGNLSPGGPSELSPETANSNRMSSTTDGGGPSPLGQTSMTAR